MHHLSMLHIICTVQLFTLGLCCYPAEPMQEGAPHRFARLLDVQKYKVLRGHEHGVWCLGYNHAGTQIASGSIDETVRVWDLHGSGQLFKLKHGEWREPFELRERHIKYNHNVSCLSYNRDDTQLATGAYDHQVRIWDLCNRKELLRLAGHGDSVSCLSYNPAGTQIASGSIDGTIWVWDALTGHGSASIGNTKSGKHRTIMVSINSLSYNPDGTQLAFGYEDGVSIRDVRNGEQICMLKHKGYVIALSYNRDGIQLASGSPVENVIRIWDLRKVGLLAWVRGHSNLLAGGRGHEGKVYCLSYNPAGTQLASGSDETVRIWDASNRYKPLQVLSGHEACVTCLSYNPAGTQLASGSMDETVRVWDLDGSAEQL